MRRWSRLRSKATRKNELDSFVIAHMLEELTSSRAMHARSGPMELSVYDDASTDDSLARLKAWVPKLEERGIKVIISSTGEMPTTLNHTLVSRLALANRARIAARAKTPSL